MSHMVPGYGGGRPPDRPVKLKCKNCGFEFSLPGKRKDPKTGETYYFCQKCGKKLATK